MEANEYDLIVIGSGPAGQKGAICAAKMRLPLKLFVSLVEQSLPKGFSAAATYKGLKTYLVDGMSFLVNDTAELAGKYGRNSTTSMVCDVSDEAQVKALVANTAERFGKIDILVNNAALYSVLEEQSFTDIDVAVWDKVMAVNIRGPFLMVKHVVPHMMRAAPIVSWLR